MAAVEAAAVAVAEVAMVAVAVATAAVLVVVMVVAAALAALVVAGGAPVVDPEDLALVADSAPDAAAALPAGLTGVTTVAALVASFMSSVPPLALRRSSSESLS